MPRLHLMNWLASQGLAGTPENEVIRGFCERCRAGGLELSRSVAFIDTLHQSLTALPSVTEVKQA